MKLECFKNDGGNYMGRNNTTDIELLAGLEKAQSKKQIENDAKDLGDIKVPLVGTLDKTKTKEQLQQDLASMDGTINLHGKFDKKEVLTSAEKVTEQVQTYANKNSIQYNLTLKKDKLINDIKILGQQNTKLFKDANMSAKYNTLLDNAKLAASNAEIQNLRMQLSAMRSEIKATNLSGLTLGDTFKKTFKRATELFTGTGGVMLLSRQLHKAWEEALNLDKAYTDLIKVQNELTRDDYPDYLERCNKKAQELATTQQALIESTTEFSKSGYNLKDSNALAEQATILSNVGDMSASDSAKAIISGVQAYDIIDGYEDVEKKAEALTNKFNEIGNTASITTAEIAKGVQTVGSVFADANTSVDEFIALLAAGNRQYQNADTLALSLRTSALRIRSCSSELQKMGEDTEGVIESTAKLEEKIKALTNINGTGGVRILEADGETFRSIYDIYMDIAKVYKDMSDTDQSALLDLIAGKHRASAISATLNNMSEAQEIYQRSLESAGSAQKEYDKYLQSSEAALNRFKGSMTETYQSVLSGDTVTGLLNCGNATLQFANSIGLVESTLRGLVGIGVVKAITTLSTAFKAAAISASNFGTALNTVKNMSTMAKGTTEYTNALNTLKVVSAGLSDVQLKQVLASKALSDADRIAILRTTGLTKAQSQAKLVQMGLVQSTKAQTTAQNTATASTFSLTAAVKGFGASLKTAFMSNPIGIAIMGLSMAFGAVTSAINSANQKAEEARQNAKEAADEANTLGDEVAELTSKYIALSEAVKTDASAKEDLMTTQTELLKKLGLEGESLDDLIEKYGSLSDAIRQASLDSLKNSQIDLIAGVDAAREELLKVGGNGWFAGNNVISATGDDAVKAFKELEKVGIVDNESYGANGGILALIGDDKTTKGIIENYERLGKALVTLRDSNAFTMEELSENSLYQAIYGRYSEMKDEVEAYKSSIADLNENLAQQTMLAELQGNTIPKTEEEFEIFRDELVETAIATKQFIGNEKEIANAINDYLSTVPEFKGFYSIPLEEEINKVDALLGQADFSKFSLSQEDISNFDTYKKNIKTISDALTDLNNLDTSDITSLMTEFPEYGAIFEKFGVTGVKGVGDLESALEEIAKQMMSTATKDVPELTDAIADLYKLIGNPHGSVDELTQELEDLDALMQRIKSGKSLDSKEIADYIGKYEELSDKVKVTADGYTFEEDALIDLYNTRVDVANKSIAYEIEQTNQRIKQIKDRLESYKIEIKALQTVQKAYGTFDKKANTVGIQSAANRVPDIADNVIHAEGSDISYDATANPKDEIKKKAEAEALKQQIKQENLEKELKELEEYLKYLEQLEQDNYDWKDKNKKGFEPEIVDGYEIAVERIEQSLSDLDKQMDDSNLTIKERNKKLKEQVGLYEKLKGVHSESAKDYKKKFDKIDLDADLKTKIKEGIRFGDGSIKLDTEVEEKAFKEAEELWKNYLDANSAIFDIDAKIQETTDLLNNPPEKDNIFDWIETKLENSEKKIENFGNVANNTFLSFANRKTAFQNQIDATEAFIKELDTASEVYKKFAEEVDLSEDLKKLVRDGDLSITNAAEMNLTEKQTENIGEYTERWEDYLETVEKKEEAVKSINELNVSLFNLHKTEADLNIEEITKSIEELETTLAKSEYLNNVDKISVLDSLAVQNKELATSCYATAEALQKVYDTIIKFDPNSEEAKSLKTLIDAFTQQGQEAEEKAIEYDTQSFDAIVEKYERTLVAHENERKAIENEMAIAEARGYIDTASYYERLITSKLKTQEENNKKLQDLESELAKLEKDNPNFMDTAVWHEKKLEIIETKQAIEELNLAILEDANAIRQIKWDVFDFMREQVAQVSDEAQFLIQLFENLDHFDDKGQLTDIGMTVMGQHAVQYEIALKEAQNYADELAKIEEDIAKNPNDEKLIDRKNELIGLYQDETLAMKNARQEMISMVEEGINLELESLQSLIDSFKEARDSAKDLYDWQKKSVSLSKNLASIEKQIAAYTNDTSEESKKKIQQLRVQLEESRDEMESAQYDRYISEQDELLTSLYKEYENILNDRMDNVDILFKELMQDVDKNSTKIAQTVKTETEKWGYDLSTGLKDIWDAEKETDTSIDNAAGSVSGSINSGVSDLKDKLDGIQGEITDNADKNSTSIKDTINSVIDSIGGTLKENETNEEAKDKVSTARWNALRSLLVTIQNTLNEIHITLTNGFKNVVDIATNTGKDIVENIKKISSVQTKPSSKEPVVDDSVDDSTDDSKQEPSKPTESPKSPTVGDILTGVTGRWYEDEYGEGKSGSVTTAGATSWKIDKIAEKPNMKCPYHLIGYDDEGNKAGSGWVSLDSLPKYHNGLERAKTDHWAWTNEGGDDEVIITKDGAVLTPIHRGDMVLNPEASRNFYQAMNDPSKFYQNYSPKVDNVPVRNNMSPVVNNNLDKVEIVLPNVKNYPEFMTAIQKDRKFENMIMDIVTSRIGNGCSMAKYHYKWK